MAVSHSNSLMSLGIPGLRRDEDRNFTHPNHVEFLERGFIEIFKEFMQVGGEGGNLLAPFTMVHKPVDPEKGWGITLIGYTFPLHENSLKVGDHFVARYHAEIPQIVASTNAYYKIRNTYTVDSNKIEVMDPERVPQFYADQLTAFSKSYVNWMNFMSYLLFADMTKEDCCAATEDKKISEDVRDHWFEDFKDKVFCPANFATSGIPWYDSNLVLEKAPVIKPDLKVTEHQFKEHINYMRRTLTHNKETYTKDYTKYKGHEVTEDCLKALSFREKIADVARAMKGHSIKYRMHDPKTKKEGFVINVRPSDLVVFIDDGLSETEIRRSMPGIIKPIDDIGFSPGALNVGSIVRTPYFPKGEALIVHKDAIKLIITKNRFGIADYNEHEVRNYWQSYGYYFDVFTVFPCCYIKHQ